MYMGYRNAFLSSARESFEEMKVSLPTTSKKKVKAVKVEVKALA
jgi:hypothetical protein